MFTKSLTGTSRTYQMIENLLPDNLDHLKRWQRRNGIHQHIPVYSDKVLRIQDTVLILPLVLALRMFKARGVYLSSRINYFG